MCSDMCRSVFRRLFLSPFPFRPVSTGQAKPIASEEQLHQLGLYLPNLMTFLFVSMKGVLRGTQVSNLQSALSFPHSGPFGEF